MADEKREKMISSDIPPNGTPFLPTKNVVAIKETTQKKDNNTKPGILITADKRLNSLQQIETTGLPHNNENRTVNLQREPEKNCNCRYNDLIKYAYLSGKNHVEQEALKNNHKVQTSIGSDAVELTADKRRDEFIRRRVPGLEINFANMVRPKIEIDPNTRTERVVEDQWNKSDLKKIQLFKERINTAVNHCDKFNHRFHKNVHKKKVDCLKSPLVLDGENVGPVCGWYRIKRFNYADRLYSGTLPEDPFDTGIGTCVANPSRFAQAFAIKEGRNTMEPIENEIPNFYNSGSHQNQPHMVKIKTNFRNIKTVDTKSMKAMPWRSEETHDVLFNPDYHFEEEEPIIKDIGNRRTREDTKRSMYNVADLETKTHTERHSSSSGLALPSSFFQCRKPRRLHKSRQRYNPCLKYPPKKKGYRKTRF